MKKEQIEEIISKMTLHEKVLLCTGKNSWRTRDYEKLGIPSILVSDGTSGVRFQIGSDQPEEMSFYDSLGGSFDNEEAMSRTYRATCFPSGSAIASSWDTELIGEIGKKLAGECKELGINMLLGPGMNIHRNPLCGRNFEYYSEDPLLTGLCAAAETKGVQSYKGHGTTIKHFAANNQEDNRMFTNAHISERALREIYLKGFEIVVKTAQPYAIMTSYNLINGTHAANHYDMLQNVARDEWGFEGFIMTDWYTSQDTTALGMVSESGKYSYSDGVQCIKAGNDLQMPGCRKNVEDIVDGVKNGRITKADLQRCAKHILGIALKTI